MMIGISVVTSQTRTLLTLIAPEIVEKAGSRPLKLVPEIFPRLKKCTGKG